MSKEEFAEHLQNAVDMFMNDTEEYDDLDEEEWKDIFLDFLDMEISA